MPSQSTYTDGFFRFCLLMFSRNFSDFRKYRYSQGASELGQGLGQADVFAAGTAPDRQHTFEQLLGLSETTLPLEQLAPLAGYDYKERLSAVFKRETGQTPGQYRQQVREQTN